MLFRSDPHREPGDDALSAGAVAGFTGCVGSGSGGAGGTDDTEGPVVVASFFTFHDFARKVADGTPVTVENLVPTGLHGHGWEPDPSITRDIVDADAFLHVGPDFQPWADRAIDTVEDEDTETRMVNVREGVELLPLAEGLDEDEEVGSGMDPHFWLDPVRAKRSVENIAEGLAEVTPENEDELERNADEVKSELDSIDDEWSSVFEGPDHDIIFLAAHNAFGYISERYDANIQPLVTNLAATDDIRPADMRRAQDTIAENDIRNIGAAVFEPRRPARQLLERTGVEAYYPVTPYAGTTQDWVERGWGYFEIARRINMETFRILLGSGEPSAGFEEEWRNFE